MNQPGLAAVESSKSELQPPEKRDRRSLYSMYRVAPKELNERTRRQITNRSDSCPTSRHVGDSNG